MHQKSRKFVPRFFGIMAIIITIFGSNLLAKNYKIKSGIPAWTATYSAPMQYVSLTSDSLKFGAALVTIPNKKKRDLKNPT